MWSNENWLYWRIWLSVSRLSLIVPIFMVPAVERTSDGSNLVVHLDLCPLADHLNGNTIDPWDCSHSPVNKTFAMSMWTELTAITTEKFSRGYKGTEADVQFRLSLPIFCVLEWVAYRKYGAISGQDEAACKDRRNWARLNPVSWLVMCKLTGIRECWSISCGYTWTYMLLIF